MPKYKYNNGRLDLHGKEINRRIAEDHDFKIKELKNLVEHPDRFEDYDDPVFHKLEDGILFPREPCLGDICQWYLGDCWLMASMGAILRAERGVKAILKMVAQDPEDKKYAVVRIFHGTVEAPSLKVKYVATLKGIPTFEGNGINNKLLHGASNYDNKLKNFPLWIPMIEQALAAFTREMKFRPGSTQLHRIEDRDAVDAFHMLLGSVPRKIEIDVREHYGLDELNSPARLLFEPTAAPKGTPRELTVARKIFAPRYPDADAAELRRLLRRWYRFIKKTHGAGAYVNMAPEHKLRSRMTIRDAWRKIRHRYEDYKPEGYHEFILRKNKVIDLLDKVVTKDKNDDEVAQILAAVKDYVRRSKKLAGRRGDGHYTKKQRELFDELTRLIAANHPITVNSREVVGRNRRTLNDPYSRDTSLHSKFGLVGHHSYGVMATHIGDEDEYGHARRYVLLFDPLKERMRSYNQLFKKFGLPKLVSPRAGIGIELPLATPKDGANLLKKPDRPDLETDGLDLDGQNTDGLFWLDLDDLTKRFFSVCTTRDPL